MKKVYGFLALLFLLSCQVQQKSSTYIRHHAALADSVLAAAFDHEAIYSMLDTIKPVSSILSVRYKMKAGKQLPGDSLNYKAAADRIDTVILYQQLCRALSNSRIALVTVPFREAYDGQKTVELYAVNLFKLKNRISEYSAFFTTLGITPETDPAQVITIIENASKYERWRGYGYLFGYPAYAVDFFVEAGKTQDSTGKFVTRDFFHIPVHAAMQGHFTYAIPKGYQAGAVDSTLYHRATQTLNNYRKIRGKYASPKGLKAMALWKHWQKKQ